MMDSHKDCSRVGVWLSPVIVACAMTLSWMKKQEHQPQPANGMKW